MDTLFFPNRMSSCTNIALELRVTKQGTRSGTCCSHDVFQACVSQLGTGVTSCMPHCPTQAERWKPGHASIPVWQVRSKKPNSWNTKPPPNHLNRGYMVYGPLATTGVIDMATITFDVVDNLWRELGATRKPNIDELALPPDSIRQRLKMNQIFSVATPAPAQHHQLLLARHNMQWKSSTPQARIEHRFLPSIKSSAEIHASLVWPPINS